MTVSSDNRLADAPFQFCRPPGNAKGSLADVMSRHPLASLVAGIVHHTQAGLNLMNSIKSAFAGQTRGIARASPWDAIRLPMMLKQSKEFCDCGDLVFASTSRVKHGGPPLHLAIEFPCPEIPETRM